LNVQDIVTSMLFKRQSFETVSETLNGSSPCSARFSLVFVPEKPLPRQPSSVVELAVCQHAQEGRLSCVDVSNHRTPNLHEILKILDL